MAASGTVLDILEDRDLNLQDVVGNVRPFPTIVPYEDYTSNVIVYKLDMSHEMFLGLAQHVTAKLAKEGGQESWTWLVQWEVEKPVPIPQPNFAPGSKRPRIEGAAPSPPPKLQYAVARPEPPPRPKPRAPMITGVGARRLDPDLLQEEGILRILIDIVQASDRILPNLVEFLYRQIDFYEGDGTALKCALHQEIPSLWDFENHPLDIPLKDSVDEKKDQIKPDVSDFEEEIEQSERLQYQEKRFGIQPPKLQLTITPLINIPKDLHKRNQYYAACFQSRQRAIYLLLEAGITIQQINNYVRKQKTHPKETSVEGNGNGLNNYFKNQPFAKEQFLYNEKMRAMRKKWTETAISTTLDREARYASRMAAIEASIATTPGFPPRNLSDHLVVPAPLIPPTPRQWTTPSTASRIRDDAGDPPPPRISTAAPPPPQDGLSDADIRSYLTRLSADQLHNMMAIVAGQQGTANNFITPQGLVASAMQTAGASAASASVSGPSGNLGAFQGSDPIDAFNADSQSEDSDDDDDDEMDEDFEEDKSHENEDEDGIPATTFPPQAPQQQHPQTSSAPSPGFQSLSFTSLFIQSFAANAPSPHPTTLPTSEGNNAPSGAGQTHISTVPSITVQPPHPPADISRNVHGSSSLPAPGISRKAPAPLALPPTPSSTLTHLASLMAPKPPTPMGIPILIYFPKILSSSVPDSDRTDAVLLGYIPPGPGTEIRIERAVFLPIDLWNRVRAKVKEGLYEVLETYPAPIGPLTPRIQYTPGKSNMLSSPFGRSPVKKRQVTPHELAYDKLLQAYLLMSSTQDREKELTKRWICSDESMREGNVGRGSVWEGWGVWIDRDVEMEENEREGALVRFALGRGAAEREIKDWETRRAIDEVMELDDEGEGGEICDDF
ncbi:hypothetical protein BCR34DRAFT_603200 [Clohesyomyces aquaticus]|uniref:Uncharacterized protein n=1 Tax=Clohesyomyces aquaticus TaxID=1231657 RepID=A0A1Y1ZFB7_9PLEO|nr:hypothetical protein BCR34DRAFT_603200 [Clohesyomyces aquaticus]